MMKIGKLIAHTGLFFFSKESMPPKLFFVFMFDVSTPVTTLFFTESVFTT